MAYIYNVFFRSFSVIHDSNLFVIYEVVLFDVTLTYAIIRVYYYLLLCSKAQVLR